MPATAIPQVDRSIEPTAGGTALGVRIYGQRKRGEHRPLVLHFHGGAFTAGDLDSGAVIASLLAEAGAIVVSLAYPLAPAHPFPAAVEAGHAALLWMHKHRAQLAGGQSELWVAGEEAGGNIAAAVALMARDQQRPPLAGAVLLSPMLDPCVATASLRGASAGPVGCKWADGWHSYLQRTGDSEHPYATPSHSRRLGDLPRTLLVTATDDPMRDDVRAYAERLRAAGVAAEASVLPGPTGWPCICQCTESSADAPWIPALRERLQQFLHRPTAASAATQPALTD